MLPTTPRTFEDWWALRTQYGTEDKLLARDAWFAAAAAYNTPVIFHCADECNCLPGQCMAGNNR